MGLKDTGGVGTAAALQAASMTLACSDSSAALAPVALLLNM